jgi:hypothetical protein
MRRAGRFKSVRPVALCSIHFIVGQQVQGILIGVNSCLTAPAAAKPLERSVGAGCFPVELPARLLCAIDVWLDRREETEQKQIVTSHLPAKTGLSLRDPKEPAGVPLRAAKASLSASRRLHTRRRPQRFSCRTSLEHLVVERPVGEQLLREFPPSSCLDRLASPTTATSARLASRYRAGTALRVPPGQPSRPRRPGQRRGTRTVLELPQAPASVAGRWLAFLPHFPTGS